MKFNRISDDLTEIDGKVRIERGPIRKKAVATQELLDDAVTAGHYAVGKPDALGKPIELGKSMDYIDWLAKEKCFYVYWLDGVREVKMKVGDPVKQQDWVPKGAYPSEMEAVGAASELLAAKPA